MSSTYTSNLNLRKPEHRDTETLESWDQVVNGNMDKIDTAFGSRAYTDLIYPPGQHFISNSDSHSLSINKLDNKMYDVDLRTPTADEKAGLVGPTGYPPNSVNRFATMDWVITAGGIIRKAVLSPEYPGAVLYDGGVTPSGGTMISDFQISGLFGYNFYKWVSTEVTWEDYWVIVRWKVPETFITFNTASNKALIIDLSTEDTGGTTRVYSSIFKDGAAGTTSDKGPISSSVGGTWYSEKEGTELLYYDFSDTVLSSITPGSILVIKIKMSSSNSHYVKIGDITIQYTG